MKLRTLFDVAAHLGADVDEGDREATVRSAERRVYKDTSCGAWLDLSDPQSVLVGTIIEGSNVEPIVSPRRLWYPFPPGLLDEAIEAIEREASVCWRHVNECPEDCEGQACGYSDHAGALVVEVNPPRRPRPRRYRVSLARSIVGWIPVACRDLRGHRAVPMPAAVLAWLGAQAQAGRHVVPTGSEEGTILAALWDGTDDSHEARRRRSRLFVTTDPLETP
jgi:hypothetical protein